MTMQQRSFDLPDLIVNLQNKQTQALPLSPIFAGAQETIGCTDSAAISTTGVSAYLCGTGAIGSGTIWCGYWTCE
jgi:ribosomal protein S12 methylthiotransferase accessory factor YcaO